MTNTLTEAELRLNKEALQEARAYEGEQKRKENDILDARMEYGHLMSSYISLANMFWLGYGAFFTINSLFATALGVAYSQGAQSMNPWFLFFVHFLIPLAGVFISACAIYAAVLIVRSQSLIETRGRELEAVLRSAIFTRMKVRPGRFPGWTTAGALFFAAIWVSTFFAISPWPSFSCDEVSQGSLRIRAFCKP